MADLELPKGGTEAAGTGVSCLPPHVQGCLDECCGVLAVASPRLE